MFQDQVLKPSSLSKKTSWLCKIIKTRQLAQQLYISSLRKLFQPVYSTPARQLLDTFYLLRFKISKFQSDFLGIREFVFRLSFLLTLDL